jgi:hypothetical protein
LRTKPAPGLDRTASVAVNPSTSGIRMSISTTSGDSRSISARTPPPSIITSPAVLESSIYERGPLGQPD